MRRAYNGQSMVGFSGGSGRAVVPTHGTMSIGGHVISGILRRPIYPQVLTRTFPDRARTKRTRGKHCWCCRWEKKLVVILGIELNIEDRCQISHVIARLLGAGAIRLHYATRLCSQRSVFKPHCRGRSAHQQTLQCSSLHY